MSWLDLHFRFISEISGNFYNSESYVSSSREKGQGREWSKKRRHNWVGYRRYIFICYILSWHCLCAFVGT